jgi:outer membrane lipoprotein-sorting protein
MRILATLLVTLLVLACTEKNPDELANKHADTGADSAGGPSDPALMERILKHQTARATALKDWAIEGQAESATGERVGFSLQFAQPGKLASRLDDGKTPVQVRFDGTALWALDEKNNVVNRRDLASVPDEDKLLLVTQTFGRLFCEGWRPPLLAPSRTRAQVVDGKPTLVVALTDDVLREEHFVFDPTSLEFIGRKTFDKQGKEVGSLTVLDAQTDTVTGLSLPMRWRKVDATGDVTIALSKVRINQGIDPAVFSTNQQVGGSVQP